MDVFLLSTEGDCSAVWSLPSLLIVPGALALVRNPLQAREWSCWLQWASHHVLSPEKKAAPQTEWSVTLLPASSG